MTSTWRVYRAGVAEDVEEGAALLLLETLAPAPEPCRHERRESVAGSAHGGGAGTDALREQERCLDCGALRQLAWWNGEAFHGEWRPA